ncbi:receptor-type tyrosine-protein phosphatase H isoform X2 [Oreochromis niloticus]|uniref:receptor-type tyrosine-protein phosphatase H isoform X2 n=1 Tax=Oreochromis niloticus TaxID=8128 RepID=UPI000DF2A928|nr:receptor-type tyrosine-protein phosphatase H isoform X2 [Oreochromis niloticus]
MKLLSLISDHLLLCVFLSLLWGKTDSTTTITATVTAGQQSTAQINPTPLTSTGQTTSTTTKAPPDNVNRVNVTTQNASSIFLTWNKVDNIPTYILQYGDITEKINKAEEEPIEHVVTSLTAGTNYTFTLFTVSDGLNSSGYRFSAVTAPLNTEEFKKNGQDETSITLGWKTVPNIDNYILVFNERQINISNSTEEYRVSDLTSGTRYSFTLFTVFGNVKSSGVNCIAVTAPNNNEEFKAVDQNETSITLMWKTVPNIDSYLLVFNGREINISNSTKEYRVSDLTSGTRYSFTLFTVFGNVSSSGVNCIAVTAPRNTEEFQAVDQNETSITLMWKAVPNIDSYLLVFNGREINISNSTNEYRVSDLTSGTRYSFTLFTVFGNVSSSGVNCIAVTAPRNAEEFKAVDQNETSINLMWKAVPNIDSYLLVFNGREINISNSIKEYRVSDLTSGTRYSFTLFTVFGNVSSSGVNCIAVTAPRNTEEFQAVYQNETSITLMWKTVPNIDSFLLVFNGREINISNSTNEYTVSDLTSGTRYSFTLFTVFGNVSSSGVNCIAVTAPKNVQTVTVTQNESSITLTWEKVNNILTYILEYDSGNIVIGKNDMGGYTTSGTSVTCVVSSLEAGTNYHFTLFTVFENVNSSGYNFSAPTAPKNVHNVTVTQNESSITLMWDKVNDLLTYILEYERVSVVIDKNDMGGCTTSGTSVTCVVSSLTAGTNYNFTLFTVFEKVNSSGYNFSAPTAPKNVHNVTVTQNESSITLMWDKVNDLLTYILEYERVSVVIDKNDMGGCTTSGTSVTCVVSSLTAGTNYNFTLFTVFEKVNSSGYNFSAPTAPKNVHNVTVTQNESSITLMWDKVNDLLTYILEYERVSVVIDKNDMGGCTTSGTSVTCVVSSLTAGTNYNFTLFTVFENVNSSGYNFSAPTVPPVVPWVSVTERFTNNITLEWENMNKAWQYQLQINGHVSDSVSDSSSDTIKKVVTSLQPGTEYDFNLTTVFAGLRSTPCTNFTVTAIDCASADWKVTNSSIKAKIEGLFSNATAHNGSNVHVSENVSFTGLYPGATYNISLVYEKSSRVFLQCEHKLTILPPNLNAHCEYWATGYSVLIKWTDPEGEWTNAEVNVTGKTHTVASPETKIIIKGFQPAKKYKVSVTSLSGLRRSSEPHVFYCQTDPRGVIAGSVFGVLLFGLLVALVVFIFLKRPDIISRKKSSFIGGSKVPNTQSKSIPAAKFPDHFHQLSLDENRGFSEEYECLAPVGTDQTRKTAILPENKAKNRFSNVLPYDWCRVKLTTSDPDGISDYINANYMPGYSSNREYIATQGPLPSTVNDFWRMIWEQRVKRIIMVTNCIEGGRTKCEQYWPADSKPCLYGELLVTMRSEQQETNWTLREFNLKDRKTSEERTVKHFHFTAWPDHGVPECTEVLIQFRGLVRQHIEREGGKAPTVVHCSAGVGRTGTIISLDVLLQQLEKEQAVGINAFVHKMRLNRPYMVQTESQYVFLHQCIMDSLQPKNTNEENIYENTYENADMIYVNATALQELRRQNGNA